MVALGRLRQEDFNFEAILGKVTVTVFDTVERRRQRLKPLLLAGEGCWKLLGPQSRQSCGVGMG